MLCQLSIANVAIIERVELAFGQGLNILTGETGAGKSILIDSLNMVLGARTNRSLIRRPAASAKVEALFELSPGDVSLMLNEWGIDAPDQQLILSREVFDNGRSLCRANGTLITLAQMKQLGARLVDVHGQHEYRYLLDPAQHTHLLDSFAGGGAGHLLTELQSLSARYSAAASELEHRFGDEQERQRRMDILQYQINEIEQAGLQSCEEEELEVQRRRAANAERICQAYAGAYRILDGGMDEESGVGMPAVRSLLAEAASLLERISDVDEEAAPLAGRLQSLEYEIEDLVETLRGQSAESDFDEGRLDEIEQRLSQIRQLKRKYGGSITEILDFAAQAQTEYDRYAHADEEVSRLEKQMENARAAWSQTAKALTEKRAQAAKGFQQRVLEQLADLGMEDAKFYVNFTPCVLQASFLPAQGAEAAQFFLSANKGEEPQPLEKVASGGELSRLMLALKAVVAAMDDIPTMIFDEIDSGISGSMARIVGQKLALIARQRQVICITHTAQIAAMADRHYYIEKTTDEERTRTQVTALEPLQREREISRLVGGDMVSDAGLKHAREMIRWCDAYKKKLS